MTPVPSMPQVAWYGTCRIHNALKLLHDAGRINLLPPISGFSHSSAEICQHHAVATGQKPLPRRALLRALNYTGVLNRGLTHLHELGHTLVQADIVMLEVSSLKVFTLGDYVTQANRIAEYCNLSARQVEGCLLRGDWTGISGVARTRLAEFSGHLQTLAACEAQIVTLLGALAPRQVILVNHFLVEDHRKTTFSVRVEIRDMLAQIALRMGPRVSHFDPTPMLRAANWPLKDYAHYQDGFKPVLADALLNAIPVRAPM